MALRLGIRRRWLRFGEVSELCCAVCPSDADCNCCFLCFTTTHPPTVPLATKRQQKIYHVANFCLYRQILIVITCIVWYYTRQYHICNTMQYHAHDEMHHHSPLLSHSMQYWTYQVNVGWQRSKPFCVAHLCVSVWECVHISIWEGKLDDTEGVEGRWLARVSRVSAMLGPQVSSSTATHCKGGWC